MDNEDPQHLFIICLLLAYCFVGPLLLWILGFNYEHLRWLSRGLYVLAGYYLAGRRRHLGGPIGGLVAGILDAIFSWMYSAPVGPHPSFKEPPMTLALIVSFMLQGVFFGVLGGLVRMAVRYLPNRDIR